MKAFPLWFQFLAAVALVAPRSLAFTPPSLNRHPLVHQLSPDHSSLSAARIPKTSLNAWGSIVPSVAATVPFQEIGIACLAPTLLGYIQSEFGVSYAYGLATSLAGYFVLTSLPVQEGLTALHAASLVFYGIRLCLFLLYRNAFVARLKELGKRIEDKAKARGNRLSRTPFILSCSFMYFGLGAPLYLTSQMTSTSPVWAVRALQVLVPTTWLGFLFAAAGDLQKSVVKARKGSHHLVTGGIFRLCRHPNYMGEMVGWTASAAAGLIAATTQQVSLRLVGVVAALLVGVFGIDLVLLLATRTLEAKQRETYGDTEEYKAWVDKSWPGFQLPSK